MRRLAVLTLIPLLLTPLLLACSSGDDSSDDTSGPAVVAADEGIEGVLAIRIASADHTNASVAYDRRVPAGGDHHPVWANCGFYDDEIPQEHIVHDLEHGAVWLAYAPTLADADVATIRALTDDAEKVIAAPSPDLDAGVAVVATAWARQLTLESVDDQRLAAFVEQYQDGDQAPEAGVTCRDSPFGEPVAPADG